MKLSIHRMNGTRGYHSVESPANLNYCSCLLTGKNFTVYIFPQKTCIIK